MKIATWNVNGIRARQQQFAEWIERDEPDVVCLQEIKAAPDKVPAALRELPGYWNFWHGAGGYSGVSLHFRQELFPEPCTFEHPSFDLETRMVQACVGETVFASVYVPNGGKSFETKITFLHALKEFTREIHQTGRQLILCGDINISRTPLDVHPRERKLGIGQLPEERALFEEILAEGLVDVGRALDPDNPGLFTWWAPWRNMRERNIGWRLDYVLASEALAAKANACKVLADVGTSDHAPVMASFE